MASLKDIKSIDATYREEFAQLGIRTTEKLLEFGATERGREELSEESGIPETKILELVNRADLFRIKGIGEEFSDLLESAGIVSPTELAHRNAYTLYDTLVDLNQQKNLVHRVPSHSELEGFIAEAKQLPKVVTH